MMLPPTRKCNDTSFLSLMFFVFLCWISTSLAANDEAQTSAGVDANESSQSPMDSLDHGILEWMHAAEGGFYNPKTEFRRASPDNPLLGVFAKERIEKDEMLCRVPWDMLIAGNEGYLTEVEEEEGDFSCATAKALAKEMELGDKSKYAPYVNYLLQQRDGQIPSAWSKPGQRLLMTILGADNVTDPNSHVQLPPIHPFQWLDYSGMDEPLCDLQTPLERKAAWMVIQRADDALIIPAYDMYNHRNGKQWMNARTDIYHGKSHETKATRVIEKGEQIHISYNQCVNCGNRANGGYGTASMFRDYGFVETFPQRWVYQQVQFDLDDKNGHLHVKWKKHLSKRTSKLKTKLKIWLEGQIRRLRRLRNIDWANYHDANSKNNAVKPPPDDIPTLEWDLCWQFHQANLVAMMAAVESLEADLKESSQTTTNDEKEEQTCLSTDWKNHSKDYPSLRYIPQNHYDPLLLQQLQDEDMKKVVDSYTYDYSHGPTCDNADITNFATYTDFAALETHFQYLVFSEDAKTGDMCLFDNNDNPIICSSFGFQRYEYPLETVNRILENNNPKSSSQVRRVLSIGAETTFLLHAILKQFPQVERVVAISEDEAKTRISSQYFEVSPLFEDDRVDWWFGDAREVLLLLGKLSSPEDYWKSFDLIYVDETPLSISWFYSNQTASSSSSSQEARKKGSARFFSDLSKLLKDDGIMITSGVTMERLNAAFKHKAHFRHDEIPIVCSESVTLGSQTVDLFLSHFPNRKGSNKLDDEEEEKSGTSSEGIGLDSNNEVPLEMRGYRLSETAQACPEASQEDEIDSMGGNIYNMPTEKSLGLLTTIDGIDNTVTFDVITAAMQKVITPEAGFTPHAPTFVDDERLLAFFVMDGGYVAGRVWPSNGYFGFDIFLWNNIHKVDQLREGLLQHVKSKTPVSSFRIAVTGIPQDLKSVTKVSDLTIPQPQCAGQTSERDTDVSRNVEAEQVVFAAVVDEVLDAIGHRGITAAVLCGDGNGEACLASKMLNDHTNVKDVVALRSCNDIDDSSDPIEMLSKMNACEQQILDTLISRLPSKIGIIVIDSEATLSVMQLMHSILCLSSDRASWLDEDLVVVALASDPKQRLVQGKLLDAHRKHNALAASTEIVLSGSGRDVEVKIVSPWQKIVSKKLTGVASKLLPRVEAHNMDVKIHSIQRGPFPYDSEYDPGLFDFDDEDTGSEQFLFAEEMPFGIRRIVQIETKDEGRVFEFTEESIHDTVKVTLSRLQVEMSDFRKIFYSVGGDGLVAVYSHEDAELVLVWDGRRRVDLTMFPSTFFDGITAAFSDAIFEVSKLKVRIENDSQAYATDFENEGDEEEED